MLVPSTMSTGICISSSTLSTPRWAAPLAPPPLSTNAILGLWGAAAGAACDADGQKTDTQTYATQKAPKSLCIAILPPVTLAMSSSKPLRKLC